VREGRGTSSRAAFYKKHNRWTEGLISAAKAVATSTNMLIETADGVISGRNSPEQLIVASNEVAASTAQLVAASRVRASFMSKTQERLETASKAVTSACRSLVRQVQDIIAQKNRDDNEIIDYAKLSDHEFKVRQMEQQVRPIFGVSAKMKSNVDRIGRDSPAGEFTRPGPYPAWRDEKDLIPRRMIKIPSVRARRPFWRMGDTWVCLRDRPASALEGSSSGSAYSFTCWKMSAKLPRADTVAAVSMRWVVYVCIRVDS
jgi:hypothetical protein